MSNTEVSVPPSYHFEGFEQANTTPVPDAFFDRLLPLLGEAELKALLYIIRRTTGFKKSADRISFNQFLRGIRTKEGRILDEGCGVKNRTNLSRALKSLEQKGIVVSEKGIDERGENETTLYRIRWKGDERGVVPKEYHPSTETALPVVPEQYPQETVKQETDLQHRDISRSTALKEVKEQTQTRGVVGQPDYPSRATLAELTPLSALLSEKQTLLDRRKTTRFSKAPPPELEAALRDVSAKLSDTEHVRENISQAANLYRAWGGVNGSSFASFVYEACAITRQQGSVRKQMPYFFQVLKDLLGLTGAEQGSITPG